MTTDDARLAHWLAQEAESAEYDQAHEEAAKFKAAAARLVSLSNHNHQQTRLLLEVADFMQKHASLFLDADPADRQGQATKLDLRIKAIREMAERNGSR